MIGPKYKLVLLAVLLVSGGCTPTGGGTTETKNPKFSFWPDAPDEPRIQFLTKFNTSRDVSQEKQSELDAMLYGKENETELAFGKPYGMKWWNGCIYFCDTSNTCITILDLKKRQVRVTGVQGQGKLQKPIDIAIAADGIKYVADTGRKAIVVFDPQDKYVRQFAPEGFYPTGVAVYQNELFVTDLKADAVKVLDRMSGQVLRTIGASGREPGHFVQPLGVAVDKSGNVYVDEVLEVRIQIFDREGKWLRSIGELGTRPGTFVRPKDMAVDSDGILYVVDAAFQNVQMFNSEGQMLMFFGGNGTFPGGMDVPAGVCVCETDLDLFQPYVHPAFQLKRVLIVSNQFENSKIALYGMGTLKPGKTIVDLAADRAAIEGVMEKPGTTQPSSGIPPAVGGQP
jgi:sugar lactone lactonase YvrE